MLQKKFRRPNEMIQNTKTNKIIHQENQKELFNQQTQIKDEEET